MAGMSYLNFDLRLERMGKGCKVGIDCSAGQASGKFTLPKRELKNFLSIIGQSTRAARRLESPAVKAAMKLGGRLFEAIFQDEALGCFRASLIEAERQDAGLRLRLRQSNIPELSEVPWEYLYDRDHFLCLSRNTPIVRYLEMPKSIRPLSVKLPLSVLAMISSPYDYPRLEVEQEWRNLSEVLGDIKHKGLVSLERLEKATFEALQQQLRRGEYHIFHFIGHGNFDEQAQDGVLLLEDESKRGQPVSGQKIGMLLCDHSALRLAILNACEGARTCRSDPFAGVAQSLIQQGLPAVIAMQFEITDEAAITFANQFYGAVADGDPVDAALAEARKAISKKGNEVEWGSPVLYMRSPDGCIFDIETDTGEDDLAEAVTKEIKKVEAPHPAIILSEDVLPPVHGLNLAFAEKLQFLTNLTISRDDHSDTPPKGNPYLNRLMIQNPDDFYGRTSELSRIYERIKAVRPQSISIVGVPRIGKSSLLKAIHHPENRRKYLPAPHEYVCVFIDLQAKRNVELDELFQYIYGELQREYRGNIKLNVRADYDGLQEVVRVFQETGLKLIFLWDEFESITKNQKLGPEFYAYFRSLANNFNVAYITSSRGQLQSLCHAKEISDSPFFNIFTNLYLGPFKPDEAKQLIAKPSARAGKPLASHTDFVLDIAGYFPLFIQIACSALYSSARAEKVDYKKARELFMEEAKPHFQEYRERFDESQRAVVIALAKGKRPPREHAFALKDLAQAGFVLNGKLFSSLFAEFVRETERKNKPWWKMW
jgi:hypothetical protein